MEKVKVENLVLGGGPGGYVAGIRLGKLGRETVLVEMDAVGGVCLNRGCIPSKALIRVAKLHSAMKKSASIGLSVGDVNLDISKTQSWKNGVVKRLTGGVGNLLKKNGVRVIRGEGAFTSPTAMLVRGEEEAEIEFKQAIIATGSLPINLPFLPVGGRILDSTGALDLTEVPDHLVIVGGGYIGLELAFMYSGFGSKVTVIELLPQVLPGFDTDLAGEMLKSLKRRRINVHLESSADKVLENSSDRVLLAVKDKDGGVKTIEASHVVVAVGRSPMLDGWGAEAAGVLEAGDRFVKIDAQCRTRVDGLFAIGDVAGPPLLAHKASFEGEVAAETMAGKTASMAGRIVPGVAFTDPEVAVAGLGEAEAREKGISYRTGVFPVSASGRALTMGAREGYIKVLAEEGSGRLIGVAILAPEASEMIAEATLAVQLGIDADSIARTIHAHPTLSEGFHEAVLALDDAAIHI